MPIHGTYKLGPENATLLVHTTRTGAASKAGHDLLIEVTGWEATLSLAEDSAQSFVELDADSDSLLVREGTGGLIELGVDDRASIRRSIFDEVLHGQPIRFRSRAVRADEHERCFNVGGDLTLVGETRPASFVLALGPDGVLRGTALLRQTDWGIKPYTTLFGTLKVVDEVTVSVETGVLAENGVGTTGVQ
jgi:polyisoprenoid-binding protein YceI